MTPPPADVRTNDEYQIDPQEQTSLKFQFMLPNIFQENLFVNVVCKM